MRQRATDKLDNAANTGSAPPREQKITFNRDNKFDLQLSDALIAERRLADVFGNLDIHKIELKTETWQWERTGNICIEYRQNGQPSGIAVTESGCWVHELRRDGQTLCYLMFPVERLKELARRAYAEGRYHEGGGDGGRFCNVLIPLSWVLR
jgi:hypothetical protein